MLDTVTEQHKGVAQDGIFKRSGCPKLRKRSQRVPSGIRSGVDATVSTGRGGERVLLVIMQDCSLSEAVDDCIDALMIEEHMTVIDTHRCSLPAPGLHSPTNSCIVRSQ